MAITRQQFAAANAAAATSVAATFGSAIQSGERVLVMVTTVNGTTLDPGTVADPSGVRYELVWTAAVATGITHDYYLCRNHPGGQTVVTYSHSSSASFRAIGAWRLTSTNPIAVIGGGQTIRDGVLATANSLTTAGFGIFTISSATMCFAAGQADTSGTTLTAGTGWSASSADGGATGRAIFASRAGATNGVIEAQFTGSTTDNASVGCIILFELTVQPPFRVSQGAVFEVGGAAATPEMPRGMQLGDYLLLSVENEDVAVTFDDAQGFSAVANSPVSVSTTTRLSLFSRYASGASMTAPTIHTATDHMSGFIAAYRYVNQSTPVDVSATNTKSTATTTITYPSVTTTAASELVIKSGTWDADASGGGALASNSTTHTGEQCINKLGTTLGNGGGVATLIGVKTAAGSTSTITASITNSRNAVHTMALASGIPPTVVPTDRADETDSAFALTHSKSTAVGRANETDIAFALARVLVTYAVGRANETDTALARTYSKAHAAGRADENDSAFALGYTKGHQAGRADETDTALALLLRLIHYPGRANETDTAFPLVPIQKVLPVRVGHEVDQAYPPTWYMQRARETDAAFALLPVEKHIAVGMAEEIDRAFTPGGLGKISRIAIGAFTQPTMGFRLDQATVGFTLDQARVDFEIEGIT